MAEDDEFDLRPNRSLQESEETRTCLITPKWPLALVHRQRDAGMRTYHMYRSAVLPDSFDSSFRQPGFQRLALCVQVWSLKAGRARQSLLGGLR